MAYRNLRVVPYTYTKPSGIKTRGQAIFIGNTFRVFIPNHKIVDVSNALIDNYEQGGGINAKDKDNE